VYAPEADKSKNIKASGGFLIFAPRLLCLSRKSPLEALSDQVIA
jgi:hypothetical protein